MIDSICGTMTCSVIADTMQLYNSQRAGEALLTPI